MTGLSVSRLYKLASPAIAEIPTYKLGGSVLFSVAELKEWMQSHRRASRHEDEIEALRRYSGNSNKSLGHDLKGQQARKGTAKTRDIETIGHGWTGRKSSGTNSNPKN